MKKISNLNVDVWTEKEICVYEDERWLMFFGPCQTWIGSTIKELEEAGIYMAGDTAVMKRDDQVIFGYNNFAEGIIQFIKEDPKYRTNGKEFKLMLKGPDAAMLGKLLLQII